MTTTTGTDEELRALEREVEQGGGPTARARWARALDRAGRRDEVFEALAPDTGHPDVRAVLADLPAFTHEAGDVGRTRWLDVRPILSTPRPRWHRTDPGAVPFARQAGLLGGSLGLVTYREGLKITVLEPDTGEVRATTPVGGSAGPPISLHGDVLYAHCDLEARAIHLKTDADLHQLKPVLPRGVIRCWEIGDATRPFAMSDGVDLPLPDDLRRDHNFGRTAQGHGLFTATGPISAKEPRSSFFIGDTLSATPLPGLIVAHLSTNNMGQARHTAFDRASRAALWSGEGTLAAGDARGLVLSWCDRRFTLRAPDGAVRWTRESTTGHVRALTPDVVLLARATTAGGGPPWSLVSLDRDTGQDLADMGPFVPGETAVAVARDTLYRSRGSEVVAMTLDGYTRWTLDVATIARERTLPADLAAAHEQVHALVPAHGRLYAKTRDGTVFALEG